MNNMHRFLAILGIALAGRESLADRYVAQDTNQPDGVYSSWATAASNITEAVAVAGAGETVWVKPGRYILTQVVTVGDLKVRSWPDGLAHRDAVIVDGNYPATTNRCFLLNNAAALVEGLTITNACSSTVANGSAVTITGGTLRNSRVTGNITTNKNCAAGVYASGASSVVENCRIEANTGALYGAGVFLQSAARLLNSWVAGNQTTAADYARGAGVHMTGAAIVDGCCIVSNRVPGGSASLGAGIFSDGGTIRNSLITGNSAFGGAAYFRGVTTLENCTVVGNSGDYQPGIVLNSSSPCTIRNVLAHRNRYRSTEQFIDIWDLKTAANPTYYTNCAFGRVYDASAEASKPWRGTDLVDLSVTDPLFADASRGDYRLQGASPCVNAGLNLAWMAGARDLDGNRRIDAVSGIADIGCYEHHARGSLFLMR